jgi:glycosyltransferase involved in cell wall biosynthesis
LAERARILFTIPNFITAGSGQEMFNIIERLDKGDFEPYIAVKEKGGVLYDEAIKKGYPVIHAPFFEETFTPARKVLHIVRMASFFKQYRFALWQSFNWSSDYTEAIIARLAGARFVYVKKNMNWGRKAWRVKSFFSNAIVARNATMQSTIFSNSYQKKVCYIPGGVDIEKFEKAYSALRDKYNIPASATLITCVAQLVRIKDQLILIKAITSLSNVYLFLAGRPVDIGYTEELNSQIEQLGLTDRVIMPGAVKNIQALLSASDLFVLPTSKLYGHEEGCPVALLEAMACKVPCISSDVAGSNDLVINGETGLTFTPGDVVGLRNCIQTFIDEPEVFKTMAQNAYKRVNKLYTLEIEAKAFENLYKKLLGIS